MYTCGSVSTSLSLSLSFAPPASDADWIDGNATPGPAASAAHPALALSRLARANALTAPRAAGRVLVLAYGAVRGTDRWDAVGVLRVWPLWNQRAQTAEDFASRDGFRETDALRARVRALVAAGWAATVALVAPRAVPLEDVAAWQAITADVHVLGHVAEPVQSALYLHYLARTRDVSLVLLPAPSAFRRSQVRSAELRCLPAVRRCCRCAHRAGEARTLPVCLCAAAAALGVRGGAGFVGTLRGQRASRGGRRGHAGRRGALVPTQPELGHGGAPGRAHCVTVVEEGETANFVQYSV